MQPQEQPQDSGQDPLKALGDGIGALVEGVQGSQLGDDVKKQAALVQQDFEQLVQMIGGGQGAPSGPQSAQGASDMAGQNPNAQAVR